MADHTVTQLNKVPDKQTVAYLNVLGTKLLPPQPAVTPVNFALKQGTQENVEVPAGTQVSTESKIIFETERQFTATVSQLKAVVTVDRAVDQVYDHLVELSSALKETTFFASPAMQEHALYLGDDNLFNLRRGAGRRERTEGQFAMVEITVEHADPSQNVSLGTNVKWSYSCQDTSDAESDWVDFVVTPGTIVNGKETITLTKKNRKPTAKKSAGDIVTFWIRAKVDPSLPAALPKLKSLKAKVVNSIHPDLAFYNDVPINLAAAAFYPFGSQPNTSDVFYIGSQEGFSKKGSKVQIQFALATAGVPGSLIDASKNKSNILAISWEYWDGKSWSHLQVAESQIADDQFASNPSTVTFTCPADMSLTKVNNKENYWIRARIARRQLPIHNPDRHNASDNRDSPSVSDVKITNTTNPQAVTCKSKNNLQFQDWTDPTAPFQPVTPVEEPKQTLYLGFDSPLGEGSISIFFALRKQEYFDDKKPRITWSYLRKTPGEEWVPIQVEDSTDNLTQSGAIEFLAPKDISAEEKFGRVMSGFAVKSVENPSDPWDRP